MQRQQGDRPCCARSNRPTSLGHKGQAPPAQRATVARLSVSAVSPNPSNDRRRSGRRLRVPVTGNASVAIDWRCRRRFWQMQTDRQVLMQLNRGIGELENKGKRRRLPQSSRRPGVSARGSRSLRVPRVRDVQANEEVRFPVYERLQEPHGADQQLLGRLLCGLRCRTTPRRRRWCRRCSGSRPRRCRDASSGPAARSSRSSWSGTFRATTWWLVSRREDVRRR